VVDPPPHPPSTATPKIATNANSCCVARLTCARLKTNSRSPLLCFLGIKASAGLEAVLLFAIYLQTAHTLNAAVAPKQIAWATRIPKIVAKR
jgi:hypothetical protein